MKLKVTNVERLSDLNGTNRVKISYIENDVINPKSSRLIYFEDSAPYAFDLKKDQIIEGVIVTREVKPYQFKNKVYNKYTVPLLGRFNTQEEIIISSNKLLRKLGVKLPHESSFNF